MNLPSELREGAKISGAALGANKLRSVLTTLGIVIGILTVSLMATAIDGLNESFRRSISALGSDVFFIEKFPWDSHGKWWKYKNRRDLELSDARAIRRESRHALAVSVEASTSLPVSYRDRSASSAWVVGNTEYSPAVRQLTVRDGRFFTGAENAGARPVCVLGSEIADKLFPREPAVGRRIKVGALNYEVVGVLDKFGPFLFANMDTQVIIPITRFVADFSRRPYLLLTVKARDPRQMDEAREELRGILRKRRHVPPGAEDDFAINQQEMILTSFRKVSRVIASVGLFITGLSLFVGGIGIMNIMFVSVAERTREIGIRKAIGAKRRTILLQFLIEAAMICVLGGLLGLVVAWLATLGVRRFLPVAMSPHVAALGFGVALVTGLLSGFMPAYRAARLNPVDALRAE
ncbi:MAG: ABC transporter permease [Verrucomicrobia bacterium]|nr:ABC transporter permease [Verrucomicrobiota bacterium]